MGEARRRSKEGLGPRKSVDKRISRDGSSKIVSWLPITAQQRTAFIELTIRGGWIGIATLALIWITVRFIGPAAGWWVPADLH